MALTDLKNAIKNKTKSKIKDINDQLIQEINEINDIWAKKIADKKAKILNEHERLIAQKVRQSKFVINNKIKTEMINQKNDIINQIMVDLEAELKDLSDKEYKKIILALLKKQKNITDATLTTVKGREKVTQEALDELKYDYKIAKDNINDIGGFTLTADNISIDNRFSVLLTNIKSENLIDIANTLFS